MASIAKCSNCGEQFERLFKFCPNCGLNVLAESPTDRVGVAIRDLFDIAHSFTSVSDLDLLLKKISFAAEKLTQCEASSVMLLDDTRENLYFRTAGGEKEHIIKTIKIKIGQGIAGWVAQKGEPLLVNDVTKDPRFLPSLADEKSGFKTRSILCVPMVAANEIIGVMEVVNKKAGFPGNGQFSEDDLELLGSLASFAAVSIANSKLNADQKNFFANVIEILTAAVETGMRNPVGHCWKVAQISCSVARRLKIEKEEYKRIYYASLMHDIGYITAPRKLSLKKGSQLDDRQERIESVHTIVGSEIAGSINMLKPCAPLIRSHHEVWDGTGFPDNLKGEAIPLGARIISLAEAVEDLRNPLMSENEFKKYIEQYVASHSNKLFDPNVAAAYLEDIGAKKEAQI